MALVYRRTKVDRSTFRKIPFRGRFWLTSATTRPLVKYNRTGYLTARSTDHPHGTAITPTTTALVRVPRYWAVT